MTWHYGLAILYIFAFVPLVLGIFIGFCIADWTDPITKKKYYLHGRMDEQLREQGTLQIDRIDPRRVSVKEGYLK